MKIGFVLDDSLDKTDGVQQYILTLGQWMRTHGHEVHYLVGSTKRTDVPNIHSLSRNVQVHFNQNRMSTPLPASKKSIRKLLSEEQFDVLHVQMPYSPFLAARVIKSAAKTTAVVGTFHILPFSSLESFATRLLALAVRSSRKRLDAVVSVSEPAARFAKKRFKTKSKVLPNVVNVSHFRTGKTKKQYKDSKVTIVYLGRLVERKGCMHFLKALQVLHEQNVLPLVRVVIGGKGPLKESLEQYVHQNHLSRTVQFVGYVPEEDKPDLLASADIAVLPSLGGESFGIVLVEAMAAGSDVVIAGDNQGYRTVMWGHPEQIVNPTDIAAFARMLKKFILHPHARDKAHAWQQARVQDYDVQRIGGELLKLYNEILLKKAEV